jgi:hypothetical protein
MQRLNGGSYPGELQAVATGRGISITAEAARRFYARPGVSFVHHAGPQLRGDGCGGRGRENDSRLRKDPHTLKLSRLRATEP